MTDVQFWQVYFTLAKKYLPPEAFDPHFALLEATETQSKMTELQSGIRRTFESARETALDWSSRASGGLRPAGGTRVISNAWQTVCIACRSRYQRPLGTCAAFGLLRASPFELGMNEGQQSANLLAETSAQLHDLVESRSRGNTPTAAGDGAGDSTSQNFHAPFAGGVSLGDRPAAAPEDLDNELEAYLKTIAKDSEGPDAGEGEAASESEEAEDLDQYLSELTTGEDKKREEDGSEEAVDLEEYMQNL